MLRLFFLLISMLVSTGPGFSPEPNRLAPQTVRFQELYQALGLTESLSFEAFREACEGYERIGGKQKNILTLIDFSKPSSEERMFVIDMDQGKLLFTTHVAHGRNSGSLYATSFSNRPGSYQSSLGFYLTENSYTGKNGHSLLLEGLENGINSNAKSRAIVIHPAPYANPDVIASQGRLGRSLGCPALPEAVSADIINTIKDGSVLYIYADNARYLAQSSILGPKALASS